MKVINNSEFHLSHGEYVCKIGEKAEVPKEVALKWFKYAGVEQYVAPTDVEKIKAEAKAQALKEYKAQEAAKAKAAKAEAKAAKAEAKAKAKAEAKAKAKAEAKAKGDK